MRQDGTCVYYFDEDELKSILCGTGSKVSCSEGSATVEENVFKFSQAADSRDVEVNDVTTNDGSESQSKSECDTESSSQVPANEDNDENGIGFQCEECYYIKRQYANRAQKVARYRVWLHGKFTKPL